MSDQELHDKLTTDPGFAASFIVHNNFEAVKKKMQELGITVSTMEEAFNIIMNWSASGKPGAKDQIIYVSNVPYINDVNNQTGGYQNFFKTNTTNEQRKSMVGSSTGKIDWASAGLAFATSGVIGLVPFLLGGSNPGNTGKTPEQIAAEEAAAKKAAEEEARKKRMMWTVISIVGALALVGTIIGFALSGGKKKTKTAAAAA